MTGILLKKQMQDVFSWIYHDKKTGKKRSAKGILLYVALYLFIFGSLGVVFYMVGDMLSPLVESNLGWLFMALMGFIGIALGVFGSVFNTFATLYQAKDNDILLSMPVPVSSILIARLSGVYAMGLMYELIVMIPAVIVYLMHGSHGVCSVLFTLLVPIVLSFLVLVLSCILGWFVAQVSSRLQNRNMIVVVVSLAFWALYYYVYGRAYDFLQKILAAPWDVADKVKNILFPFYHMGLACEGNIGSMLIFTAMMLALTLLVYVVLARGFIKLVTTNRGTARAKYKEKPVKAVCVSRALLRREWKHFTGSPVYMLNCGLGIVIMPVLAVILLVKGEVLVQQLNAIFPGQDGLMSLFICAGVCMSASMIDITAPSVSLEGKQLWLVQVFPVSGWQVLRAKLSLHLVLGVVPAWILGVSCLWLMKPAAVFWVLVLLVVMLFLVLLAETGLVLNLKMPNLSWRDEMVPVKQSMSVLISLLGGWILVFLFGGLFRLLKDLVTPILFLTGIAVFFLVTDVSLTVWLKSRGADIFEKL